MKKSLLVAILLIFLVCSTATAFVPLAYIAAVVGPELAPYVATSLVIHGAAAVTGLYYYLRDGSRSSVAADGTVKTPAQVQWIDLTLETPAVQTKNIQTETSFNKQKNIVNANPSKYPNLHSALNVPNQKPAPVISMNVGDKFTYNGTSYIVTTKHDRQEFISGVPPNGGLPMLVSGGARLEVYFVTGNTAQYSVKWGYDLYDITPSTPDITTTPATVSQYVSTISETDSKLKAAYQAEINKMHQDENYIPTFTDETTGLPAAPPPPGTVATPKQVSDYNKARAAAAARESATAANNSAVAAAQTAANNAGQKLSYAQSAYNANPGDPSLAAALAAAQSAADAANAALAQMQATAARSAAEEAEKESDSAADVPTATRRDVDLTAFTALKGALNSTYPFNLPQSIYGYYSRLVAPAQAPTFELHMPYNQKMLIDLSPFEPIAIMMRYLIGILVTAGMFYYIIHFFRGIS